jgi:hypothetical protein
VLRGSAPAAGRPAPTLPGQEAQRPSLSLHQQQTIREHPAEVIARQLAGDGDAAVIDMAGTIETMLEKANDLGEFRMMLSSAYGDIDSKTFAHMLAGGLAAARAAGRSDIEDESE